MWQNINMTSYKEFYVNECLVMFLEFYLSLKYNVILLNRQRKAINSCKIIPTDRRQQLIGWKGFSFCIHLLCSLKSWFLSIALRVILFYYQADQFLYKMICIHHIIFQSGNIAKKKKQKFTKPINYICTVIIIKMSSFPSALNLLLSSES